MDYLGATLNDIAKKTNVLFDPSETVTDWKRRVVYSVCGRMMLSSLWDYSEDRSVSVQLVKRRGKDIMQSYQLLFPEIASESNFGEHIDALAEKIYELHLINGQMYHKNWRVSPSRFGSDYIGNVVLLKGLYATDDCFMSGIGPYITKKSGDEGDNNNSLKVNRPDLESLLSGFIDNAKWYESSDLKGYEFLRTTPPFTKGYWLDRPDRNDILLMRYKNNDLGPKTYFLHKSNEGRDLIADLPDWIGKQQRFTMLAIALLKKYDALPKASLIKKDTIANVKIPYYLPPEEGNLIREYTWPKLFDGDDSPFERVISIQLYDTVKLLLNGIGFEVEEM